ncbi:MAG: hypothetical protein ACFE0J_14130 [Elainellaceae cyanobacterium]
MNQWGGYFFKEDDSVVSGFSGLPVAAKVVQGQAKTLIKHFVESLLSAETRIYVSLEYVSLESEAIV